MTFTFVLSNTLYTLRNKASSQRPKRSKIESVYDFTKQTKFKVLKLRDIYIPLEHAGFKVGKIESSLHKTASPILTKIQNQTKHK